MKGAAGPLTTSRIAHPHFRKRNSQVPLWKMPQAPFGMVGKSQTTWQNEWRKAVQLDRLTDRHAPRVNPSMAVGNLGK
jgi:hypothetical protein